MTIWIMVEECNTRGMAPTVDVSAFGDPALGQRAMNRRGTELTTDGFTRLSHSTHVALYRKNGGEIRSLTLHQKNVLEVV
jgi:hypothetical protein